MGIKYTRDEILRKCKEASENMALLYNADFVNYTGITKDTKELVSKVVSEYLCENIELFDNIPCITRKTSYKTESHLGKINEQSNREENTAKRLFLDNQERGPYKYIGTILDYQTPLKDVVSDEVGKIDLLSVNGNIVYVLELKQMDSKETMLRCILESYTYLKTVDSQKLIADFELSRIDSIKASPLVFKQGNQWNEMNDNNHNTYLKKLSAMLDVVPYYIEVSEDGFIISDN